MKNHLKIVLLIAFVLGVKANAVFGQNLVPNGSFENIIICPDMPSQFQGYTSNWFNPNTGTPDFFSTCANPNQFVGIPNDYTSSLLPIDGQSFTGLILFRLQSTHTHIHYRGYLAVSLINSLIKDSLYNIKINLSLAQTSSSAISNISAIISKDSIFQSNNYPPMQIDSSLILNNSINDIINNKGNWSELSFNFKANGDEKYLYIGNFNTDSLVNYIDLDTISDNLLDAYYLIDNISLVRTNEVGLSENVFKPPIKLYPNPAQDYVSIDLPIIYSKATLQIINMQGQLVKQIHINTGGLQRIETTDLPNGIYQLLVSAKNKLIGKEKLVVVR